MAGDEPRAANLEVKCVDLAANPYLLLGGLLAAGRGRDDGGARRCRRRPPATRAQIEDAERERRGIERLPTNMGEVINAFTSSPLLREALGPVLADAVVAVRRGEWARTAGMEPADVAAAYRWVY